MASRLPDVIKDVAPWLDVLSARRARQLDRATATELTRHGLGTFAEVDDATIAAAPAFLGVDGLRLRHVRFHRVNLRCAETLVAALACCPNLHTLFLFRVAMSLHIDHDVVRSSLHALPHLKHIFVDDSEGQSDFVALTSPVSLIVHALPGAPWELETLSLCAEGDEMTELFATFADPSETLRSFLVERGATIERLDVPGSLLCDLVVHAVAAMPRLRAFGVIGEMECGVGPVLCNASLRSVVVTAAEPPRRLIPERECPHVVRLVVGNRKLPRAPDWNHADWDDFGELTSKLPGLCDLTMLFVDVPADAAERYAAALSRLPRLESVGITITSRGKPMRIIMSSIPPVTRLLVRMRHIDADSADALAQIFARSPALERLALAGNTRDGEAALGLISSIQKHPGLREVFLTLKPPPSPSPSPPSPSPPPSRSFGSHVLAAALATCPRIQIASDFGSDMLMMRAVVPRAFIPSNFEASLCVWLAKDQDIGRW